MPLFTRNTTPEIGVDELEYILGAGDSFLLDVREDWEFRRGRVPGARQVPLGQLPGSLDRLPRDKRVIVICEHGNRSLVAARFLLDSGFADACSVRGGTSAWARADLPLERE